MRFLVFWHMNRQWLRHDEPAAGARSPVIAPICEARTRLALSLSTVYLLWHPDLKIEHNRVGAMTEHPRCLGAFFSHI